MRAPQLCDYAGITYRQLDHWCSKGYLKPLDYQGNPGSGVTREFTRKEGDKARLMACLIDRGFTVPAAEKIAQVNTYDQQAKSIFLGHGITVLIEPHSH